MGICSFGPPFPVGGDRLPQKRNLQRGGLAALHRKGSVKRAERDAPSMGSPCRSNGHRRLCMVSAVKETARRLPKNSLARGRGPRRGTDLRGEPRVVKGRNDPRGWFQKLALGNDDLELRPAVSVPAGLLIRNIGLVAVMALIWAMIVEAIVARMPEQEEFVIDHSAVFLARVVAGLLVAALAWCTVILVRRRANPPSN